MDASMQEPKRDEDPSEQDEPCPSVVGKIGEYGKHIEQGRELDLVVVGVADLRSALRPVQFAQADSLRLHGSGSQIAASERTCPEQQRERQDNLDKQR